MTIDGRLDVGGRVVIVSSIIDPVMGCHAACPSKSRIVISASFSIWSEGWVQQNENSQWDKATPPKLSLHSAGFVWQLCNHATNWMHKIWILIKFEFKIHWDPYRRYNTLTHWLSDYINEIKKITSKWKNII